MATVLPAPAPHVCERQPWVSDGVCYIPLTRGKVALVDKCDADMGLLKWFFIRNKRGAGYAVRTKPRPAVGRDWLHRAVAERMGLAISGKEVDHVDCDGLNNRRANLRAATDAENSRNQPLRCDNKSGFKGVWWIRNRWLAAIVVNGKRLHLGTFSSIDDAAVAYAAASEKHHGAFRRLR